MVLAETGCEVGSVQLGRGRLDENVEPLDVTRDPLDEVFGARPNCVEPSTELAYISRERLDLREDDAVLRVKLLVSPSPKTPFGPVIAPNAIE